MDVREELSILVRSRQPLLSFVTGEEERAREIVERLAVELGNRELFFWNSVMGFRKVSAGTNTQSEAIAS